MYMHTLAQRQVQKHLHNEDQRQCDENKRKSKISLGKCRDIPTPTSPHRGGGNHYHGGWGGVTVGTASYMAGVLGPSTPPPQWYGVRVWGLSLDPPNGMGPGSGAVGEDPLPSAPCGVVWAWGRVGGRGGHALAPGPGTHTIGGGGGG